MKRYSIIGLSVAAWLTAWEFSSQPVLAQEQQGIAAKAALINVANRFGADRVQWIVELRGYYGQPQPEEWEIVLYDPEARYLVREFWAGQSGEVTNEGPDNDFYPDRSPTGFLSLKNLKLDSKAAFTVAEGEARKAKIGFDAVNYYLRAREYSREPIWTLELVDSGEKLLGKIYISGSTGEVLRTVWILRSRVDGEPAVIDSAAPQANENPGSSQRSFYSSPRSGSELQPERKPIPTPTDDPVRIPKPPVPPTSGDQDTAIPPPPLPPGGQN